MARQNVLTLANKDAVQVVLEVVMKWELFGTLGILFFALGCTRPAKDWQRLQVPDTATWKTKLLPKPTPVPMGNAQAGLEFMLYGDFLGTGVPMALMQKRLPIANATALPRTGDNAGVGPDYTVFTATSGAKVINGNCFTCHAGTLNGQYILGLGNTQTRFQNSLKLPAVLVNRMVKRRFRADTPERKGFGHFGDFYQAIAPYVRTNNPGPVPAFRLEEACVNYRNPVDLTYRPEAAFSLLDYTLASDVPPLWNIDKKNALYYNGMGRGDFRKLLLQAVVLGTPDSSHARRSLVQFGDVLAWAGQLQPPPYPYAVDTQKAAIGQVVFAKHCQGCHGSYQRDSVTYPSKLVSLSIVKTDPLYAVYLADHSGLPKWYNQSWFAQSEPRSALVTEYGYLAPPLDGIWATAPYLHNASVPTLDDLLNSTQRPVYWQRVTDRYDPEKVGWQYTRPTKATSKHTFNTTLPGYSKQGHTFGDKLTPIERQNLLEYLKTL